MSGAGQRPNPRSARPARCPSSSVWLPALERHAKTTHLLLTPDGAYFLLSPRDAGGVHVCARWAARAAFVPATLRLASRHGDAIGLRLDVAGMRRALRGAAALSPESVDVRLTTAPAPTPGLPPTPTLRLVATGGDAGLTHDLPLLARPLAPADVDALAADRDAAPLAPWYVDVAPRAARLAAAADRLAALAPAMTVELCPSGALRLRAAGGGAALAVEAAGLDVLPPAARAPDAAGTPPSLADDAPPPPGAVRVPVSSRDAARALGVAAATRAARALVGVTAGGAALHFVLAMAAPGGGAGVDADTDLTVRVPVLVEEGV